MAVVDRFLLARKFMPRWQNADNDDGFFWRYVTTLLPQVATEYNTNGPTVSQYKCEQVLIGKSKVTSGKNTGRVVAKQQRCAYCIISKKLKTKTGEDSASSGSGAPNRARRTAYTCICHRDASTCKEGVGGPWLAHLKDCGVSHTRAGSSDDEDQFDVDSD
jgi:hypothetical protein